MAEGPPSPPIVDVRLRDVIEEDLPFFFEHQRDPEADRMVPFTPRDREAFEAHWARILEDETVIKRTVLVDGRVAGNVVCFDQAGERLVGYWIGREHWGRGVATRALSEFLGQVKERPLHARVAKRNVASIRVLEKCGFTLAGEESDGEVDEWIYELPPGRMRP
jgi:RimJ/RimL family protein N-acetyltransferase